VPEGWGGQKALLLSFYCFLRGWEKDSSAKPQNDKGEGAHIPHCSE